MEINESGIVVGTSELPNNSRHACYWSPSGAVTDLGTLGGTYGVGFAINKLGQVAGTANPAGDSRSDPFLWTSPGGMQDLGRLGSGEQNAALAINDNTDVVGFSCLDSLNSVCHAFLWTQAGGMQDLGTLGGNFSEATGINLSGHVTGWSERADGTRHGFLWTAAGMQEIAPGAAFENFPWGINDSDEIAGSFVDPLDGQSHAFSWTQATGIRDLGVLASGWSEALGINDSRNIVGFGRDAHQTGFALIWRSGNPIQKLGPLAGIGLNAAATGINKSGQIAANGTTPELLTPTWVKFSTHKMNFGSWPVGQTSTVKTATLTNIGSTPLTIKRITIAGTDRGDFAQTNTCGPSLAAGAKCSIHVSFTPTATGIRNAVIQVSDSDRTSPQQISLTGTGT